MKKSLVFSLASSLLLAGSLCAADLDPATMSNAEWTEYRYERLTLIRTTPDFVAQSQQLESDAKAQAAAVEAAMVKADPSIAPLLAKLATLLRGNWFSPAEGSTLSGAEWQKIRDARAAALQANPDLVAGNKALKEKSRAFKASVDAALVKADPSLAGLIAKMNKNSDE